MSTPIVILVLASLVLAVSVLLPSLIVRLLLAPLLPGVIFRGAGRRRQLALTIDDGPSPAGAAGAGGSMALLARLQELQVPATFFLISSHLHAGEPAFVEQALAAGHGIGHHMTQDSVSACLSPIDFEQAFEQAADDIRQADRSGRLSLRWFRPGGGWVRPSMLASVATRGYRLVLGSIFPWDTLHPPLAFMRWFVLNNAHPGGILILHDRPDTLPTTLKLLHQVVPALRRRGYTFVSLDELLNS